LSNKYSIFVSRRATPPESEPEEPTDSSDIESSEEEPTGSSDVESDEPEEPTDSSGVESLEEENSWERAVGGLSAAMAAAVAEEERGASLESTDSSEAEQGSTDSSEAELSVLSQSEDE
jgi:hypothetical protein